MAIYIERTNFQLMSHSIFLSILSIAKFVLLNPCSMSEYRAAGKIDSKPKEVIIVYHREWGVVKKTTYVIQIQFAYDAVKWSHT